MVTGITDLFVKSYMEQCLKTYYKCKNWQIKACVFYWCSVETAAMLYVYDGIIGGGNSLPSNPTT